MARIAERAADFLADDDAAERGREHRPGTQRRGARSASARRGLGLARMLQHERALEIAGAVKAGRQAEMPFEQGARVTELINNGRDRLSSSGFTET